MKICVISSTVFSLPPQGYSGLEMLVWQISKGLAAKGHEVAVIAPNGSTCPGCEIIESGPAGHWDECKAYANYWKQLLDFEVVLDHSWHKWSYILKGEGVLKAPILGVCHAPINTMYGKLPPNVAKPCFVCISRDQALHFEAIHSREAKVCHNGIDTQIYQPLNIHRSERYLFLARFSTIKGPDIAIDACLQAGVGLDLVGDTSITGEPGFFERCKQASTMRSSTWDLHRGPQIVIRGPATRGECVWWFSQAKALLHPNLRFREPFGLAPIEAMACGCPVIAWRYGAMRETIDEGASGFLVDSLAEMVGLLKGDSVSTLARSCCRKQAAQFSEQRMIDRYEELCEDALKNGGW